MSTQGARLTTPEKVWFLLLLSVGSGILVTILPAVLHACGGSCDGFWLGGFVILTFISLFRQVRLSAEDSHSVYTLDDIPLYALMFVKGWEFAAVAGMVGRLAFDVWRLLRALVRSERVNGVDILYQVSDVCLVGVVTAATGTVYAYLAPPVPLLSGFASLAAIFGASLVWLPLAFGLKAIGLTLRRHLPLFEAGKVLRESFAHVRIHIAMLLPLGALLAYFLEHQPLVAILLVVPITTLHNALGAEYKVRSESQHTIQALAHYLEARDEYTQGHSERVSQYAAEIAREMGLAAEEVEQVRRAGLIHDIGKVDIPDAILRKPSRLTDDERQIMRTHVDRAVELGDQLEALRRELPFKEAAFHHESYDGTGHYGLVGEQIPLISRILAVADTFDAMTSDRPYRKGMPLEKALKIIDGVRGTQLDPRAVDAFLGAFQSGAIPAVKARWNEHSRARG